MPEEQPLIEESIQVPVGLSPGGLGRRYLARCIDQVVLLILLAMGLAGVGALSDPAGKGSLLHAILFLAALAILWIGYGAAFESSPWQATPGKKLCGLRVYDSRGERLSLPLAIGRNGLKEVPFIVLGLLPAGQFLALVLLVIHVIVVQRSPVNQAIHDRFAHTWVAAPEETIQLHIT